MEEGRVDLENKGYASRVCETDSSNRPKTVAFVYRVDPVDLVDLGQPFLDRRVQEQAVKLARQDGSTLPVDRSPQGFECSIKGNRMCPRVESRWHIPVESDRYQIDIVPAMCQRLGHRPYVDR